jgi:hypothetical protein
MPSRGRYRLVQGQLIRIGAVLGAALLLGSCASPLSGEYARGKGKTLQITQKVWDGYRQYLSLIQGTNSGDFVVAALGGIGIGYTGEYCPGTSCIPMGSRANRLMDKCRAIAPGVECILFAHSSEILVDYQIVEE